MGQLRYDHDQWVWDGTFHEKQLPKDARFRWDPRRRVWWTKIEDIARNLRLYADGDCELDFMRRDDAAERSSALSEAANAGDVDFPCPEGLEYMPFQVAGIAYALGTACGNALLADEMGLGKTVEALGVLNAKPVDHVLVICPATIKRNWAKEGARWLVKPLPIRMWDAGREFPHPAAPGLHIINYDIIARHVDALSAVDWDTVILDESHRIKNGAAKRTSAAIAIAKRANRVLCLTGTPLLNRPDELWTTVHLLDPQTWASASYYMKRYCAAHNSKYGWNTKGHSNLEELNQKLRASVMIRRLKRDVLVELPAKRRQLVELDPAKYGAVLAAEQKLTSETKTRVVELKAHLEKLNPDKAAAEYKAATKQLNDLTFASFSEIAKVRHETALAKVQDVVHFAEDALTSEAKLLIYAHHRDVVESIRRLLVKYNPVVLTGETKQEDRSVIVDKFQTDESVRVFIGSTTAAGVGITLTATSTVIFAELDWTPANLNQAEDRSHRIGQSNPVNVYHLLVDGSIDARMAQLVVQKQEVIDQAIDATPDAVTIHDVLAEA